MAFHIKNPETDALARRVAALKKIGLTEAVHTDAGEVSPTPYRAAVRTVDLTDEDI